MLDLLATGDYPTIRSFCSSGSDRFAAAESQYAGVRPRSGGPGPVGHHVVTEDRSMGDKTPKRPPKPKKLKKPA